MEDDIKSTYSFNFNYVSILLCNFAQDLSWCCIDNRNFSPPSTMLLYEDILTGDELFSDAFPVYDPSLVY